MRTIEKKMLEALKNKTNWQLSNTAVFYENCNTKYGPRSEVYLFGNHIGDYWHQTGEFDTNEITLLEWPSVTTISRLRALDVNVRIKKGQVLLNEKPLTKL